MKRLAAASATPQPLGRRTYGMNVKILRRLVLKLSHSHDFPPSDLDLKAEVTENLPTY